MRDLQPAPGRLGLVLMEVSPRVAAHISVALTEYRQGRQKQYVATPPELRDLEEWFAARASQKAGEAHRGSGVDGGGGIADARRVEPHTFSYDGAADWLGCSRSTVKREVAAGRLLTVQVGSTRRIHIADLERYLDERRSTA